MKRWLLTPVLALALAALVHAAPALEADPNKDYPINTQAGACVIVAATYKGKDGADLAHQLVYHLRKDHHLPAYVWNFAEKQRADMKAEETLWKQQHPQAPFKHWRIEDEYGVLIGGFENMDNARDFMNQVVKKLPLPPLKLADGKSPFDVGHFIEESPNGTLRTRRADLSPFVNSFVSRNPAFGLTGKKPVDPFLKEMNAEEEYSLLKCKSPWTMAVQAYGGGMVYVNQKKTPEEPSLLGSFRDMLLGSDKHTGDTLNAAAMQANETARVLHKMGFEAYVLHTRHASIVTIGGFSGPDDPAMKRAAEHLTSLKWDQLKFFTVPYEVPRPTAPTTP